MPLEIYPRGGKFWYRGRIDRLPGSRYYRGSTRTSDEAEARRRLTQIEEREIKRHYAGAERVLSFAEAVLQYPADPATARYLEKILPHLGETACADIAGRDVRQLAKRLYPKAAVDTWRRQVLTPVSAVINAAHDAGQCPPIKIRGFSAHDRIEQDRKRGKASRQAKVPGDWPWIEAFRAAAKDAGKPQLAALALLMFTKGCRIGQAVALTPADLDLQHHRLRLPAAKGHDAQWVEIAVELVVELANLAPRRPRQRMRCHLEDLRRAAVHAFETGQGGRAVFRDGAREVMALAGPSPTGGPPIVSWWKDGKRITKREAATIARTAEGPRPELRVFGYADRWSAGHAWRQLCERAGLDVRMPHAAGRHGFGTEVVGRLGIDPASAAREGRWSSPAVLLNTYAKPVTSSADIQAQIRTNRVQSSPKKSAKRLK